MKAAIMVPGPEGGTWDICEVQRPVVPPGQILLRVRASSINRAEFRRLHNLRTQPGKPAPEAMPVPAGLSWEEAACIPVVFVVVHDALFASGQLHKGETVLVTAAPSGVGVTTLVLAKYLGAKVIGTSRSAEKLERLKQHGLDVGVVTGSDGFGAAIAPHIGENGVDMVVDNIGGDVLAPSIAALAVGGRFVTIGRMSGVLTGELDVDRLAERRLHLYGVSNRLRSAAQRAESMRRFVADLMPALGDGRIRPIIDRCFALDDLPAAQAHVEADRHVGKVVIQV